MRLCLERAFFGYLAVEGFGDLGLMLVGFGLILKSNFGVVQMIALSLHLLCFFVCFTLFWISPLSRIYGIGPASPIHL